MRKEIRSFSEQLSDPSPALRAQAADQLAQHAKSLLASERPLLLVALKSMVEAGNERSDFLFGLHSIGLIGLEQMPSFTKEGLPLRKADAARIVLELCSLGWVSEKFPRDEILRAGLKALRPIAGDEPRTSILGTLLASIHSEKRMERMLALVALFSFEINDSRATQKAAFATLDWDPEVRFQAEQAYRSLSRFGHPLRAVALCTPSGARLSAHAFLNRKKLPMEELEAFKEFAIISFLRRLGNGSALSDALVERGLLSAQDVNRYAECALMNCPSEERKAEAEKRRNELKGKIRQLRREQELLSIPDGIPSPSPRFAFKKPERASRVSQLPGFPLRERASQHSFQRASRPAFSIFRGPAMKA